MYYNVEENSKLYSNYLILDVTHQTLCA